MTRSALTSVATAAVTVLSAAAVNQVFSPEHHLVWSWLLIALVSTIAVLLLDRHRHDHAAVRPAAHADPAGELDRAAAQLAQALTEQWSAEYRLRRLQDPSPLPVSWTAADPLLMDHWENIHEQPAGPPGRHRAANLAGRLDQVVETFARVPSRRLVVLGAPGAGKTVLLLQLTLALLRRRQDADLVPVIFPLASWHPDQPLRTWMVQRLTRNYPALAAPVSSGTSRARELVGANRILPVLDGLDELPPQLRAKAITALNRTFNHGDPVVVSCRTQDYRAALDTANTVVRGAAVVQLQPLTLRQAGNYLRRTSRPTASSQPGRRRTKWEPVLAYLRDHPDDPVARSLTGVLTNPLMITLARAVYSDTNADPDALLDPRYADPGVLEGHLLDAFVPASLTQPRTDDLGNRSSGHPWPADRARGWLSFLAAHLTRLNTQDLGWWQLERAVPWPVRGLLAAVGIAVPLSIFLLVISATSDYFYDASASDRLGLAAGALAIGVGLAGGLALGMKLFTRESGAMGARGLRANLALHRRQVRYGCALGVPGGLLLAAATLLEGHHLDRPAFGLAAALIGGIGVGLIFPATGVTRDLTPSTTPLWRVGLARLIRRLGKGLAFGLTAGLLTALSFGLAASLGYAAVVGGASLLGRYPDGHLGRLADGTRYVQMSDGTRFGVAPGNKKYVVLRDGITLYPIDPAVSKQLGGLSFISDVEARSPDGTISFLDRSTGNWSFLDRSTGNWSVLEHGLCEGPGCPEAPPPAVSGLRYDPRNEWLPVDPVDWVVDKTRHSTLSGLLLAQLKDVPLFLLAAALVVGLGVGLLGGVYVWLDEPADVTRSISPTSTLRTDRTAALVRSLTVVLLVTFTIALLSNGSEANVGLAIVDGLYVASPIGLIMVCLTTWGRLAMARCWLATRRRLPWRIMAFLREGHRQGILRQAGGVYQFRHARLQNRLSATASFHGEMTSDRPQPSIADAAPAALPLGKPES